MTRDSRLLLLLLLLILLMASGLFLVEARHRPREETAADARHRHRHRHDSSATARRNRHDLADRRGASWSQELDYEDDSLADREIEERADEEEEDDYDAAPYYERSYPRTSAKIPVHGRTFESRYPSRLHRGGYRGTGRHDQTAGDEDRVDERRRASSPRHGGRGYRARTHRRPGHSRSRDHESDEDEFDRVYGEDASPERQRSWGKYGRKHSLGGPRRDWRFDARRRHRFEDPHLGPRLDEWRRRRFDLTESKLSGKSEGKRTENSNDYEYPNVDDLDDDAEEEEEEEEENDDDDDDDDGDDLVWKETDDKNRGDNDEELDNDFYKSEGKPPLKTYDDIIRRLTSNDPTTGRPTVRRDYRNTESERHAKREPYGNFKYEPRNFSRPLIRERGKIVSLPAYRPAPNKFLDAASGKSSGSTVERKPARNASVDRPEKKATGDDARPKTKSLEQDYDEYLNTPDNEKEEDLVKAGVEEDSAMQADVTNTDYTEDEDEGETPATRSVPSTTTTTTTTSTTTTTTTTTTTPRPAVAKSYDYRDPRSSEGQTGAQYNGYQSKNDYPPMSAHSVHKWQSLGTREGVKEARSNMQQYNKNGKSAEILEALQHAIKVSREGSCQWPRPRVIPVRDVYPSPSTTYIPHCAILHRCSDDTGCCRSEALTCVPKHSHRVELSFYTANVGGGSVVEKLSFYNHTECECRERSEYETSNEKPSEPRIYRHHRPSSPQPQNMRRAQPRKPCRCPSEFTPRMTSEGECQCTCYENDQNCIKIKRGKGYFSLADRLCIQNDACAPPSCEFGDYMRRQGKCPRKKDKFDAIANYHTNLSYRYRS